MSTKRANILCLAVLALGSTAMLGHVLGSKAMKSLGLATGAAPYTKVFCQARTLIDTEAGESGVEYETFAADFSVHYTVDGEAHEMALTPEVYQKLRGPYNRRNVYGAVIAYGPALPSEIRDASFRYALLEPGKVAGELDFPEGAEGFEIVIKSKTKGSSASWRLTGGK